MRSSVFSMISLVSHSPKMAQPSGMEARASFSSAIVQVVRSPSCFREPMTVLMAKVSKTW